MVCCGMVWCGKIRYAFVGRDATTWKYIRRISMFQAKALRLECGMVKYGVVWYQVWW